MRAGGTDLTDLVAELRGSGVERVVLVMRHGAREYDRENPAREPLLPLTERGRAEARAFGERLAVPSARFESSPVGRCRETATLVGEGAAHKGVSTDDNVVRMHLGAFFIKDLMSVVGDCIQRGAQAVFVDWAVHGMSRDDLMDPDLAYAQMMTPLVNSLRDGPAATVCVTHDANIYLARTRCFANEAQALGPVGYLEGFALFERGGELQVASPQLRPRPLPQP